MSAEKSFTRSFANGITVVGTKSLGSMDGTEYAVEIQNWKGKIPIMDEWGPGVELEGPTLVVFKGQSGLTYQGFLVAPGEASSCCQLYKLHSTDQDFHLLVLVGVPLIDMDYYLEIVKSVKSA